MSAPQTGLDWTCASKYAIEIEPKTTKKLKKIITVLIALVACAAYADNGKMILDENGKLIARTYQFQNVQTTYGAGGKKLLTAIETPLGTRVIDRRGVQVAFIPK